MCENPLRGRAASIRPFEEFTPFGSSNLVRSNSGPKSLEQLHPAGQRLKSPCVSHQEADEEIEWLWGAWGSELDPDEVFDSDDFDTWEEETFHSHTEVDDQCYPIALSDSVDLKLAPPNSTMTTSTLLEHNSSSLLSPLSPPHFETPTNEKLSFPILIPSGEIQYMVLEEEMQFVEADEASWSREGPSFTPSSMGSRGSSFSSNDHAICGSKRQSADSLNNFGLMSSSPCSFRFPTLNGTSLAFSIDAQEEESVSEVTCGMIKFMLDSFTNPVPRPEAVNQLLVECVSPRDTKFFIHSQNTFWSTSGLHEEEEIHQISI
ncbi:hypothetical protein I305_02315 [Cryptococcus gattii E566]|uniref:Uncharacterized protein n=1 Tax=Cryptococcus gattii EJB2 TaxID=1296103 RepID=A0ABR5BTS0_9TREE|nr:hypothetical protein I306_03897 [Cryptococcus gattii EJB2]KIY35407.1 hypothetical protein I305_02315 [Cryptococcus gattii E566]KJE00266.1 hypothetical protein I311_06119 [Cryptococcus gattii NT-10]